MLPGKSIFLLLAVAQVMQIAHAADKFWCGPYCSTRRGPQPTCKTVCAAKSCKAFKGNINGAGIFLDVSGEVYPSDGDATSVTPAGCCSACKQTDGCNAWVLCNNPSGCGSGCKGYTTGGPDADPLKRIGTFHSCTSDDKYPYQMCSLKTVKNVAKPPLFNNGAAEGWVSGAFKVAVPSTCPSGITAATCKMCKATKSFSQCVDCAKTRKQVGLKSGCGWCSSLATPEQRSACIKVFVRYGDELWRVGCDSLVTDSQGNVGVPSLQACFDKLFANCSAAKDPATCTKCFKTTGGLLSCVTCANLPDAQSRKRCSACLSGGSKNGCENCIAPLTNIPDATRCINCYATTKDPLAQSYCYFCSNLDAAGKCKDCVEGLGVYKSVPWYARKGCYWFLDRGETAPDYKAGIACLKAAKNGEEAEGCYQCGYKNDAAILTCLAKLKKQKTTRGKLYTHHCIDFDGVVNAGCLACVDKASSNDDADRC